MGRTADTLTSLRDRLDFFVGGLRSGHVYEALSFSGMHSGLTESARGLAKGALEALDEARNAVNAACIGLEPWQIIAYTIGSISVIIYVNHFLHAPDTLSARLKKALFRLVRRLPFVKAKIAGEIAKARADIEHTIHSPDKEKNFHKFLPDKGMDKAEIAKLTDDYVAMGRNFEEGQISGTVYGGDPEVTVILTEVFGKTAWSNPLHPDVFPGVRKMEAEVIRMTLNLFHGGPSTVGCLSSGGTESLLLCCLAYRNRAYEKGIHDPEMVIPVTAHAAFDKAGAFFNIRVIHIRTDPVTQKVDVKAMKRAITSNTCMLVGSAPGFAHGVMDPLEDIARLGERHRIPVHVDACLGGFLIPFMEMAGSPAPHMFDFRLPGVTSISADTHKYGFATKGSSVLMYRNEWDLHQQFFAQPNWPGGIYASPTLAGSRCGANIATCWAALMYYGKDGYVESTRNIIQTTQQIADGIREIPELEVVGKPEVSVVAFTSTQFSIYLLADKMAKLGWNLNALQFPSGLHIAVTPHHCRKGVAERFLKDLARLARDIVDNPPDPADAQGAAAIYGTTQAIPDRSLVSEMAFVFLDSCFSTNPPKEPSNGHSK